MPAEFHYWSGSSWIKVYDWWVWNGSQYKYGKELYAWDGATWRLFYSDTPSIVSATKTPIGFTEFIFSWSLASARTVDHWLRLYDSATNVQVYAKLNPGQTSSDTIYEDAGATYYAAIFDPDGNEINRMTLT